MDVCLISGTQPYEREAEQMILPGYEYANHRCSEDTADEICGGVSIYVKTGRHAARLATFLSPVSQSQLVQSCFIYMMTKLKPYW